MNHILKQSVTTLFRSDWGNDQTPSLFPIGSAFQPSVDIAHGVGNNHRCHRASPALLELDREYA